MWQAGVNSKSTGNVDYGTYVYPFFRRIDSSILLTDIPPSQLGNVSIGPNYIQTPVRSHEAKP